MNDLFFYVELGLRHVLDWNAYDHVLFIIALCASYTFKTWKSLLVQITFFTIGHSLSLLLGHYNVFTVDGNWVEFLIPVSIILMALYSGLNYRKARPEQNTLIVGFITLFFGLIHGFGFSSYFNMITEGNDLLHLLEFAIGIELSQIVVALAVLILAYVFQNFFKLPKKYWILLISILVVLLTIPMLIENWIFT